MGGIHSQLDPRPESQSATRSINLIQPRHRAFSLMYPELTTAFVFAAFICENMFIDDLLKFGIIAFALRAFVSGTELPDGLWHN